MYNVCHNIALQYVLPFIDFDDKLEFRFSMSRSVGFWSKQRPNYSFVSITVYAQLLSSIFF